MNTFINKICVEIKAASKHMAECGSVCGLEVVLGDKCVFVLFIDFFPSLFL